MPKALRLTISGPDVNDTHLFRSLPVRIGRDDDRECQLGFWFLSRQHARIELTADGLVLVDECSKHGTYIRNGSERIRDRVLLGEIDGRFQIGPLSFHALLIDEPSSVGQSTRLGSTAAAVRAPTRTYSEAEVDPGLVDSAVVLEQVRAALSQQRDRARDVVLAAIAELDETQRTAGLQELVRTFPELLQVPALAELVSTCGVVATRPDAAFAAHQALEALLARYVPHASPLDGPAQVEGFVRQLDAALRCLIEGVTALLFAYGCESGTTPKASTPADLAAFLLDEEGGEQGATSLNEAFVDIVTHHATVTREALEGFRGLLQELSPEAFDSFGFGPLRAGARWAAYRRRHAELSQLETTEIARLFGVSFARTCRALAGHSAEPAATGAGGGGDEDGARTAQKGASHKEATRSPRALCVAAAAPLASRAC